MPNIAERIRRAHYRAWRRGTRELDLLLGRFASQWLELARKQDNLEQLELFEELLDENDTDIYDWLMSDVLAPRKFQPMIDNIKAFHKND